MSQLSKRVKRWLSDQGQLPKDIILDYPRITMIGQIHIYIENHQGLRHFSSDQVIVNQSNGRIVINGRELVIKNLLREDIVVEGHIDAVNWEA
ncbi:sporulation protein YqfC [Alkalibacillus flavidus]|uniref:Sporulation protein YqfC n=1 Tax=Alkalibacillus flavidus TaxID=546021 RepID=A0ABV2KV25_9BACI